MTVLWKKVPFAVVVKMILAVAVAATLLAFLAGCGYHVAGYGSGKLLSGQKSVSVLLFANKTYRSNLEVIYSASLVDEFARRSGGNVLAADSADLHLSGIVKTYAVDPVSYTSTDAIKEYRIVIEVEETLRDRASQRVLWKGEMKDSQTYPATTDLAQQQNSEDAAIKEIFRKLAQRTYQRINEDF